MKDFDQIDLKQSHGLSVTWDIGRRCNLDCTYCPSYRHDNHSPFASLEELKEAGDFVLEYLKLMMTHRTQKAAKIDFTGGEPTINPSFREFSSWMRAEHQKRFADEFSLEICLTSNGIINRSMRESLLTDYDYATFSYHCETTAAQKDRFLTNIQFFKDNQFPMKVNVMFHAKPEFFEECLAVCEKLRGRGVDFVPRLIGEKDNKDRYNHQYSREQLAWMKHYWENPSAAQYSLLTMAEPPSTPPQDFLESKATKAEPKSKESACSIGRPCCGSREMSLSRTDQSDAETSTFVGTTAFKDWYCSVNWYFLHIEQQTGEVFHHQTCQARFDYSRGPIGHLSHSKQILLDLKEKLESQSLPVVKCSKSLCGCGLCAPKAKSMSDFSKIMMRHANTKVLAFTQD